jgi:DNA-binding GntR family transcriptional regulator
MSVENNQYPFIGKKQSKSEYVYNFLVDGIMSGNWDFGDRINDKLVSEQLGVNRLAVREALSRLIENDVVEQQHWKGYFVKAYKEQDIKSFLDIRIALESLAMSTFLSKPDEYKIPYFEKFQENIENQKKSIESSKADHSFYLDIDYLFHEILYEASGNPLISKVVGNLRIITNLLKSVAMGRENGDFFESVEGAIHDHEQMLEAFKNNDLIKALEALNYHLAVKFYENIIKNLPSQ